MTRSVGQNGKGAKLPILTIPIEFPNLQCFPGVEPGFVPGSFLLALDELFPYTIPMLYAVIMAGGQGTRLWPASRKSSPKQLQPFADGDTMLTRTYKRMCKVVDPANIRVSTTAAYADEVGRQLPDLQMSQLIIEPEARNNAPAVGLAAAILNKEDPDATMVCAWSDSTYSNEEEFLGKLKIAIKAVEENPGYLMTVPEVPTMPATGFGYIEIGEQIAEVDGEKVYAHKQFLEKPVAEIAEEYFKSGRHFWNTGSCLWKTKTILEEYQEYMPDMYEGLMTIAEAWGTATQHEVLTRIYPAFQKITIDYAIFEKTKRIAVVPAKAGWRDIGSWQAVHEMLAEMNDQDLVTKGKVQAMDTSNSLIFNENEGKLVAVIGMKDVVVVDTPDALLVMPKSRDQEVKKIISHLEETGELDHL